jgi:hypothetical protein
MAISCGTLTIDSTAHCELASIAVVIIVIYCEMAWLIVVMTV